MTVRAMEPMPIALAALLKERGLTQTDLWSAADLSPAVVSSYLSGKRGAAIDHRGAQTIERMAKVLEVSPEYFLEYRAYQIREIAKRYPKLADQFYDVLMAFARSGGESNSK